MRTPVEEVILFIATGDEDQKTKLEKIEKYVAREYREGYDKGYDEGFVEGLNA